MIHSFKNQVCLKRWLTHQLTILDCDIINTIKSLLTIALTTRTITPPSIEFVINNLNQKIVNYQDCVYHLKICWYTDSKPNSIRSYTSSAYIDYFSFEYDIGFKCVQLTLDCQLSCITFNNIKANQYYGKKYGISFNIDNQFISFNVSL
jgi:hypothetical protein